MKFLFIAIASLSLVGLNQLSGEELPWLTNIEKAKKTAKKAKKPILIYFTGSDWCGPCKSLDQDFFHSEKFAELSDKFVLVKLDVPRRLDIVSEKEMAYNKEMLKEYNPSKRFPTVIALTSKGSEINRISSYSQLRDPQNYFKFLDEVLN